MIVFNTPQACVMRSESESSLADEKVLAICMIVHICWSNIQEAACAQLSCGCATFGALERECALYSSKSHKLNCGCFDTLVSQPFLLGLETLGPSLNKANNEKDMERPIVPMIRSKASLLHDFIWADMAGSTIISNALF